MAIKKVAGLIKRLTLKFLEAAYFHCEPAFREAAEGSGDSGGGVNYHGWKPFGIPGAKFNAMTGQNENTNLVRQARAAGKGFQAQVIERPDYYGAFEKYNSLKM